MPEGPESCHAAPRASVVSSGGARRGSLPRSSAAKAGAHFLPSFSLRSLGEGGHGTNFNEHYVCRGTRLIGAANLSPVTKLVAGTGAVSRYKLSRSQKAVTMQDFNCVQMRVSGCMYHYKFVLSAGAKQKL